ncbi:hypothetical protein ES705_08089 [subsurface metagenome]
MADERLSKLQRWMLTKCYEKGEKKVYFIWRRELIRKYCREVAKSTYSINSIEVTITNSIRNLAYKEYIFVYGSKEKPVIDYTHVFSKEQKVGQGVVGDNIKMFCLTDKGIESAKKLLNIKK